jgi:hypothetical protein
VHQRQAQHPREAIGSLSKNEKKEKSKEKRNEKKVITTQKSEKINK